MRANGLIKYLKDKKNLVGVEVGVAEGNNAETFCENLQIKKLYLVDPYIPYIDPTQGEGLIELYVGMKHSARDKLAKRPVKWIYEKSEDAVDKVGKIDFVYIDGCHDYKEVKKDIEIWTDKVKQGGIVAGHDYPAEGVKRAVDEYTNGKYKVDIENMEWYFIK